MKTQAELGYCANPRPSSINQLNGNKIELESYPMGDKLRSSGKLQTLSGTCTIREIVTVRLITHKAVHEACVASARDGYAMLVATCRDGDSHRRARQIFHDLGFVGEKLTRKRYDGSITFFRKPLLGKGSELPAQGDQPDYEKYVRKDDDRPWTTV